VAGRDTPGTLHQRNTPAGTGETASSWPGPGPSRGACTRSFGI